jgi:hypothetical protein
MTLTDFLLARISEDSDTWKMARDGGVVITVNGQSAIPPPAWVETRLAEGEARRRIVEKAQRADIALGHQINPATSAASFAMTEVLTFLALPYADHPDYREEWLP